MEMQTGFHFHSWNRKESTENVVEKLRKGQEMPS